MMIDLQGVDVDIPVFLNEYAKSARTALVNGLTGGRLAGGRGNRVTVKALRGVNLRIEQGQRVGLVGRNGAGKTTLLRAVAGIIPTSGGTVSVNGEVRSFFNLYAGLDTTQSGKANIVPMSLYYTRDFDRIRATVGEIIDFADIGDFIHLPVYTYSAGMQARLLVAIATAYGGDILVFDEVLAAGDANFMAKVEKRFLSMRGAASCMLLATHSVGLMSRICNRVVWLDQGTVKMDGPTDAVIPAFIDSM